MKKRGLDFSFHRARGRYHRKFKKEQAIFDRFDDQLPVRILGWFLSQLARGDQGDS